MKEIALVVAGCVLCAALGASAGAVLSDKARPKTYTIEDAQVTGRACASVHSVEIYSDRLYVLCSTGEKKGPFPR